jgi:pimeloyl-ACP methyl ester carboxylesterase
MKIFVTAVIVIVSALAVQIAIALGLIVSQRPSHPVAKGNSLDFSRQTATQTAEPSQLVEIPTGQGVSQWARLYPSTAKVAPLVILIHGSGWHGLQFAGLAKALQPFADVVAPDMRGHGPHALRRGDVDYTTQLEDDIAALITAQRKPGQKVVLAGHSSGGGMVVRFAGGAHRDLADAAVLMAPFLKYNAPTTRPNSGGWAHPLTRRIIGISMLNMLGIKTLDYLTAMEFAFPKLVLDGPLGATATRAYSYRMVAAFAPRAKYLVDIAKLPRFLLIAGSKDEAFVAEAYQPLMSGVTDKGQYQLIQSVSHLDIVNAPETAIAITGFLASLK